MSKTKALLLIVAIGVAIIGFAVVAFVTFGRGRALHPRVIVTLRSPAAAADARTLEEGLATLPMDPGSAIVSIASDESACIAIDARLDDLDPSRGVRERLSPRTLHAGAEPPMVVVDRPSLEDLHLVVQRTDGPGPDVRIVAATVVERLQRVAGVGHIELCGGTEDEVAVTVDVARLAALGATVDEVARAIETPPNAGAPLGHGRTFEDVSSALVAPNVRVRDVATVARRKAPPECTLAGAPGAVVATVRSPRVGARDDATRHQALVRELAEAVKSLPPGTTVRALEPAIVLDLEVSAPDAMAKAIDGAFVETRRSSPGCTDVLAPKSTLLVAKSPTSATEVTRAVAAQSATIVRDAERNDTHVAWVTAPSSDVAEQAAEAIAKELRAAGVTGVVLPRASEPVHLLQVDASKLSAHGIATVPRAVNDLVTHGSTFVGTLHEGNRSFPVRIALEPGAPLDRLVVGKAAGTPVVLAEVASIVATPGRRPVIRRNRRPAMPVGFRVPDDHGLRAAKKSIGAVALPAGASVTVD